jgi:hypothetical protein
MNKYIGFNIDSKKTARYNDYELPAMNNELFAWIFFH